jgi:periplasmic protein TonB
MSDEQWFGFRYASSFDGPRPVRAVALSIAIHISVVFLLWAALILLNVSSISRRINSIHIPLTVETLIWKKPPVSSSGGGGGDHSLLLASRGAAPPASTRRTLLAPMLVTNPDAKLQVIPVIDANASQLPSDQWGDPLASSAVFSVGPGMKGIGIGNEGDGSGRDTGYGPNSSGKPFSLSQVATRPMRILKIEPEYSERARQAKFQGTVGLRIVIDEHGIPQHISVVRMLGLGLDERAIEAVTRWRFKPALKNGKPVAVEAFVDVNFRLL